LRGSDLEADLRGRDFTLNAMAAGPDGCLIDPLEGLADLQARLVRAVDETAFDADPLRMLRAVRLVAELGLRLEAKTANWIVQRAALLPRVASERVRDEFVRILATATPADYLHMLDELGVLAQIVPEVEALKEQAQSFPHRYDVWWHTLMAVEAVGGVLEAMGGGRPYPSYVDAPQRVWDDLAEALGRFGPAVMDRLEGNRGRALLRLAALFHDLGKPLTCTEDEQGRLHFYAHEQEGARLTAERMRQMRFRRVEVSRIQLIVRHHLRPAHLARTEGAVTRRAIYRFFRAIGDAGVEVVLLSLADHLSTWGPNLQPDRWARRLGVAQVLLAHYFERKEETVAPAPLVTGRDLMDVLGLRQGPEVGRLLEAVREAQAADEVHTRDEALALAHRLVEESHGGPKPSSG
jgi:poly(A) polymerase